MKVQEAMKVGRHRNRHRTCRTISWKYRVIAWGWMSSLTYDDYWNSLDSTDRIPGVDSYTFDGDTLIWNGTPIGITFECEGGNLMYNGQFAQKWRLSSDCQ